MTDERRDRIEHKLKQALTPTLLLIKDQSHLHVGHAGAKEGKGHFDVLVVSDDFVGRNRIERHRMVFKALGALMDTDIHALSIHAYAPDEHR